MSHLEPFRGSQRNRVMRAVLVAAVFALAVVPSAAAKFKRSLVPSDRTPAVGQTITVTLRSERALPYDLKLIAVAPGKSWFDVVGRVTGDSSSARADIPTTASESPLCASPGIAGGRP